MSAPRRLSWQRWLRVRPLLIALAAGVLLALAGLAWLGTREPVEAADLADAAEWQQPLDPAHGTSPPRVTDFAERIARGAYLARVGNCAGCHSAPGGVAWAGGRAIATPFGTAYAGNLTPDAATGLGRWSADDFWRALHHGRSRDGRLLLPVFPYAAFTQVTRADSDALHAYLRTLAPVSQPPTPQALRWPFGSQPALAIWRGLFFRAGVFQPDPARPADWNRGAYLVRGLGHCAECHAPRNALGAVADAAALRGGSIPVEGWLAPSLSDPAEGGVGAGSGWPTASVVALLRDGVTGLTGDGPVAVVLGPMADVVYRSTQHWRAADLQATAAYLQALPGSAGATKVTAPERATTPVATRASAAHNGNATDATNTTNAATAPTAPTAAAAFALGARLYVDRCADCHGDQGQGEPGAHPALAGNRALTQASSANLIQLLRQGGFPPSTAGHPRPHGMPPAQLDDAQTAALLSWLRQAWGHHATPVSELDVLRAH